MTIRTEEHAYFSVRPQCLAESGYVHCALPSQTLASFLFAVKRRSGQAVTASTKLSAWVRCTAHQRQTSDCRVQLKRLAKRPNGQCCPSYRTQTPSRARPLSHLLLTTILEQSPPTPRLLLALRASGPGRLDVGGRHLSGWPNEILAAS